jgi:hypothetical protein
MPNIVGEYFNEIITKQVDQRQKIYGSINRDNNQLNYLNNRTGWCKLVSSVDIDEDATIRKFNLTKGSDLAKNCILFAGLSYSTDNSDKTPLGYRYGVAEQDSVFNNTAYGFGGLEFGLRPMPGIISAEIKTETRGSIKRATIKVQANNRQQFDIIDLLYLRLGYSVLLEWGHSSYYDNNGEYITDNSYSLVNNFLNPTPNFNYDTILTKIQENRLASCGNYDALFAKVVNFNWTFTNEGTYDITINLISLGDVIESLKANTLLGGGSGITAIQQQRIEEEAPIQIPNIPVTTPGGAYINPVIDAINSLFD